MPRDDAPTTPVPPLVPVPDGGGPARGASSGGAGVPDARGGVDWAATPLGPRDSWPAALRVAADAALGLAFPAILAWGDALIAIPNEACRARFGPDRPAAGKPLAAAWPETHGILGPVLPRVLAGESVGLADMAFRVGNGSAAEEAWLAVSISPVRDETGAVRGLLAVAAETTEATVGARRRDALIALGDALRGAEAVEAIAAAAAETLGGALRVARAGYGVLDDSGTRIHVPRDWHRPDVPSAAGDWDPAGLWDGFADALHRGETVAVADVATDPRTAPFAAAFAAVGVAACLHVPVLRGGRLSSLLFLHDTAPRAWTGAEVAFVRDVAGRVAGARDRARAIAALRESEDHHRHAVELHPQVSWTALPSGALDRVNHRWFEWTGTTGLGATWAEGLHPEDRERSFAAWAHSLTTGEPYDIRHRVRMRDGRFRWAHSRANPRRDAAGAIVKWYGATEDAHDALAAAEALRASEARFRALVTRPDAVIWRADATGHLTDAPLWEEWTGQTPEAFAGAGFLDAVHPDDRPATAAAWGGAGRSGEPVQVGFRLRMRNGSWRWVHAYGTTVRDDAGAILEWIGTITDVHDRRHAEAARSATETALRHLNATLESRVAERTAERDRMWRSSRDLLCVVDAAGVFRAASPSWTTILGHAPEEMIGRTVFDYIVPEDGAPSADALADAVAQRDLTSFENRYRHADGGIRDISWYTSTEGDLIFAYGRDVTEDKAARAALAEAQEQLRQAQKMEAVGQLTGGIAHDFNNMLAVVMGGLSLLKRRLDRGETDVARYVDAAMEGAGRAASLTQRLLAFSRQQALTPATLDPNALVEGMTDLVNRSLGTLVRVGTELTPGAWPVHADRVQLESALLNLSVNARDAMPEGGTITLATANLRIGRGEARRHEATPGDYARITVSDTGTGMTADVAARAFDPFFTTKGIGKGTGLGLSQVFGFVRQSGGFVTLDTAPGEGTRVALHLPRHAGDVPLPDVDAGEEAGGGRGEIILLVEDEERVRSLGAETLRDLGYRVIEAANAEEAMPVLDGPTPVALLFTDVVMPGLGGPRLAEIARVRRPALRVLFATGFAEGGVPPGAHVLHKPFGIDDLASHVRAALDG